MANELYIYDTIGEGLFESGVTDKSVASELKGMDKAQPIAVYINSFGGSVKHGLGIYNQLKTWQAGVNVRVDGLAASIASVIAMAGTEIVMTRGSRMMIHRPWTMAEGTAEDFRQVADQLDTSQEAIEQIYAHRTGLDADKLRAMVDAETWMLGQQAVDMGFATAFANDVEAVACVIPAAMRFKNAPQPAIKPVQRSANKIAAMQRQLDLTRAAFCR